MTDDRLAEMWQFIRRYGSGNCWTGTTGTAAAMILELLKEREQWVKVDESTSQSKLS